MKLITVLTVLVAGQMAFAQSLGVLQKSVIISDRTTNVTLELDASTVKCLVGDYGASSLKISVPELNRIANFNHTTEGESLPCINAGPCKTEFVKNGLEVNDILGKGGPTESAKVRVVSEEYYYMETANNYCYRGIVETVTTEVRGLPFKHVKEAPLATMPLSTCRSVIKDL